MPLCRKTDRERERARPRAGRPAPPSGVHPSGKLPRSPNGGRGAARQGRRGTVTGASERGGVACGSTSEGYDHQERGAGLFTSGACTRQPEEREPGSDPSGSPTAAMSGGSPPDPFRTRLTSRVGYPRMGSRAPSRSTGARPREEAQPSDPGRMAPDR